MLIEISELLIRSLSSLDVIKKHVVQHTSQSNGDGQFRARPRDFTSGVRAQLPRLVHADHFAFRRPSRQAHRPAQTAVQDYPRRPGNRVVEVDDGISTDVSEFNTSKPCGANFGCAGTCFHPGQYLTG